MSVPSKSNTSNYRPDLLELAAGYAQDSVVVTTAQLELPGPQFLYVNSAFTRMTGYSARELLGKTPRILQGEATCRETLARLRAELAAGRDFIARTTNYRRDGSPFEIEWIISHIRDERGRTTHYVAIQRDITGRQLAETELRARDQELRDTSVRLLQTLRELERAERQSVYRERLLALGEMAAGVAHDLNNALTPLVSVLDLLGRSELAPRESQWVESARAATEHAVEVVKNLQHFYRADDLPGTRQPIDMAELAQSVRELTRPKWSADRSAGSAIEFDVRAAAVPPVDGNLTELRQALVNLVFNAVDAMPSGGRLEINVSCRSGEVVVEVVDTGEGMADDVACRCFEPYFTTKSSGSGLGLSICHGVVKRHGGRIETRPNPDGGTVFRICLPPATRYSAAATATAAGGDTAKLRMLYIDDAEVSRDSMKALLCALGHEVDVADGGDSGLERWREREYDVLLTDLTMAPTTGVDVTRAVKSATPEMPVILLSGLPRDEVAAMFGGHMQPDAILEKPFSLDEIEALLEKLKHT
ncbi:MAG: PAS domain S-box protein [Planctomycetales bacterium]|nr:PAS domain S-box protein [Planctomycetales bacterium]